MVKRDHSWPKDLPALLIQQIRLQWYKDCRGRKRRHAAEPVPQTQRSTVTSSLIIPLACPYTSFPSYRVWTDFMSTRTAAG